MIPSTIARPAASEDCRPKALTSSGRLVALIGTQPHEIDLRDVAGHLARLCRFSGATTSHYSVAQHSVMVADLLAGHGAVTQLYGLLHDGHEYVFGDITTPVRRLVQSVAWSVNLPDACDPITELTRDVDAAIHNRVGLAWPLPAATANLVRHADLKALATELRDVCADPCNGARLAGDLPPPMRGAIKPWPWIKAEERFLEKLHDLATLAGLNLEVAA